ncbi:MAG: BON domain-containing protein [Humidesulfovibrio sp.]|nr:BON domain-containing protein [Humidesulfovibrio sp.]
MSTSPSHALAPNTLRTVIMIALGLWLFCAGGCAMLPFALTTTASLAMPQNASLAMAGVKGMYNTAYLASDERNINTIVRDNMLSLKAQSAILTAHGSSGVQVHAYNGELFAVGVVDTQADRDRAIAAMQNVKGVGAVKGYIRLRGDETQKNRLADDDLELRARMALGRHILHKNAGVDIQAVDGQLCLTGVVGTHAEALDIIQYLETVTGKPTLSLLAIRDEYATGHAQTNRLYLLEPGDEDAPVGLTRQDDPQPLPNTPIPFAQASSAPTPPHLAPRLASLAPQRAQAPLATAVNKTRLHMQQKLTAMAQREANPRARAELLALAGQVAQDRDLSISDRLSVAADTATQQQAKTQIQALLALY